MQVGVAARGAEYRPGPVDGRAIEHALGYCPGQVDTQAADLAHRGDSRVKGTAQIACAARGPQRDRFERNLPEVHGPDPYEVTVAVPHSGQHSLGPTHRRARSAGCFAGGTRIADDRTVEHDHTVADRLAGARHKQFSFDPFHALSCSPLWSARPSAAGHHGGFAQLSQRRAQVATWPPPGRMDTPAADLRVI